jgi:hypothetical protein
MGKRLSLSEKINATNKAIEKYFKLNPSVSKVMAKDLMPFFIKEGIFNNDHREGLPIRSLLRELDDSKQLHLIPTVLAERKSTNTNWYFIRPRGTSSPQIITQDKTQDVPKKTENEKTFKSNSDKDEQYVIDLCDEVLKQKASRQHRFDFLLGDAGTKLPVDSYYESLNLVIEYREKQHTEEVKHFDKPDVMTVSGVHRGEQRKIYDERRREVLPKNGIKLVEISYSDFEYDSSKQIKRNRERDIEIVKKVLTKEKII